MQLPGVDDASTSKETAAGHATGLERGSVEVEDSNPNLPEPSHPHFFGALPLQRGGRIYRLSTIYSRDNWILIYELFISTHTFCMRSGGSRVGGHGGQW